MPSTKTTSWGATSPVVWLCLFPGDETGHPWKFTVDQNEAIHTETIKQHVCISAPLGGPSTVFSQGIDKGSNFRHGRFHHFFEIKPLSLEDYGMASLRPVCCEGANSKRWLSNVMRQARMRTIPRKMAATSTMVTMAHLTTDPMECVPSFYTSPPPSGVISPANSTCLAALAGVIIFTLGWARSSGSV